MSYSAMSDKVLICLRAHILRGGARRDQEARLFCRSDLNGARKTSGLSEALFCAELKTLEEAGYYRPHTQRPDIGYVHYI